MSWIDKFMSNAELRSPERHPDFGSRALFVSSGMMEEVPEYGTWIAEKIRPWLSGDILEVGCGYGMYTHAYASLPNVTSVTAVDLSDEAISTARRRWKGAKITFRCQDARAMHGETFDGVICANVLEHIDDDVDFCRTLLRLLKPGKTLVIIVPAHQWLYSQYDLEAGHYRRYTRTSLRRTLTRAQADIDRLFSFNMIGALGWLWTFRRQGARTVEEHDTRRILRLYRTFVLPVSRIIEWLVPVPFGLSVVACCHARR